MTDSASDSRSARIIRHCQYCDGQIHESARSDALYCSTLCRSKAAKQAAMTGRVRRVNKLRNGLYSVTVHVKQVDVLPGDRVLFDKLETE